MGLERDVPCAKGAICSALDRFSQGFGARNRIRSLRDAIAALAPTYEGLSEAFDGHLLAHVFNTRQRSSAVAKLKDYWFDPDSPTTLFPGKPVARIYAEGVLRTLDLSLRGGRRSCSDRVMVDCRLDGTQDAELRRCQSWQDGGR